MLSTSHKVYIVAIITFFHVYRKERYCVYLFGRVFAININSWNQTHNYYRERERRRGLLFAPNYYTHLSQDWSWSAQKRANNETTFYVYNILTKRKSWQYVVDDIACSSLDVCVCWVGIENEREKYWNRTIRINAITFLAPSLCTPSDRFSLICNLSGLLYLVVPPGVRDKLVSTYSSSIKLVIYICLIKKKTYLIFNILELQLSV